ncbi:hypothetical protein [Streptomyces sp. NBC_00576]|nr:hypothetical protein [Streptomyces sp. NBC_00576]WUB69023.1 hypothetical protein OG734_02380 [Streptomyces sp. NBC_00576]
MADEHWRLDAVGEARLPAVVLLQPRGHDDLAELGRCNAPGAPS